MAGRSAECRMEVYSRTGNYDILMGGGCGWRQAASFLGLGGRLPVARFAACFSLLTWDADEGTIKGEERSDGHARLRVVISGRRFCGSAAVLYCHKHYDKHYRIEYNLYNFVSGHWQPPFSHLAVKDGDLIEWSRVLLQKASASRRCASDSCYALPDQYTPDITASCTPQGILFHAYAEEGWDMSG